MTSVRDFVPLASTGARATAITCNVPLASTGRFIGDMEKAAGELDLPVGLPRCRRFRHCLLCNRRDGVPKLADLFDRAIDVASQLGGHCVLDQSTPEV